MPEHRINIEKSRYDQSTFIGRAKHFFLTTNPKNVFKSDKELDEAKSVIVAYRSGELLEHVSEDQLWQYKHTYDSAFHPDTGNKMILFGRMSFQVPANIVITGCLMSFYKTTPSVVFWQWFNQTFNAVVNYTNNSGDTPISVQRLATSYALATTGAVSTAIFINRQVHRFPSIFARLVPLMAVIAANCINIPCMRSNEIVDGINLTDAEGNKLGSSRKAAAIGISQVVFSRIMMAAPSMLVPAYIMNKLEKNGTLKKIKGFGIPLQLAIVGSVLIFSTPLGCAIFPQQKSIAFDRLEESAQNQIVTKVGYKPQEVYYNKGL